MDKKNMTMEELINNLSGEITGGDIVAAKQLAKVSATLAKVRIDRGMNQKEFARCIGVSQGMISRWESKEYNFTIEALSDICDKLGLELEIKISNPSEQYMKLLQSKDEAKGDSAWKGMYVNRKLSKEAV